MDVLGTQGWCGEELRGPGASRAMGVRRLHTRAMLSRSTWELKGLGGIGRFDVFCRRSLSGGCKNVAPAKSTCRGGGGILKVELIFG